jgi:SAM-dependent methyltransferase
VEKKLFDWYISASGTILDVACAAGRVAIPLASCYGLQVIGFDISLNQVRAAAESGRMAQGKSSFLQSDMRAIGLFRQTVDYIFVGYTSLGALHERRDREKAVSEFARVLKPRGIGFVSVWNRLWPGFLGVNWLKWMALWFLRMFRRTPYGPGNRVCWEEGGYVLWHYFWPWEAESLFKQFGFQVLAIIPFGGAWHNNRVISDKWWSRWFGEGLYFVLVKEK